MHWQIKYMDDGAKKVSMVEGDAIYSRPDDDGTMTAEVVRANGPTSTFKCVKAVVPYTVYVRHRQIHAGVRLSCW